MCPRSSDPFYIVSILYKTGNYFLDTQYVSSRMDGQLDRAELVPIEADADDVDIFGHLAHLPIKTFLYICTAFLVG